MWLKFKWDMFVTSFIPLWISIIIFDLWDIVENAGNSFSKKGKLSDMFLCFLRVNILQLVSIVFIIVMVMISACGINKFFKDQKCSIQKTPCKILKAKKANKLSSEFLLAYILPLIASDFSNIKSIVLFLTSFAILAFLCIRNNNIYINIMLEFKKYRIYSCDVERPWPGNKSEIYYESLVISKCDLTSLEKKEIFCYDCDNYIYIHVKENDDYEQSISNSHM